MIVMVKQATDLDQEVGPVSEDLAAQMLLKI